MQITKQPLQPILLPTIQIIQHHQPQLVSQHPHHHQQQQQPQHHHQQQHQPQHHQMQQQQYPQVYQQQQHHQQQQEFIQERGGGGGDYNMMSSGSENSDIEHDLDQSSPILEHNASPLDTPRKPRKKLKSGSSQTLKSRPRRASRRDSIGTYDEQTEFLLNIPDYVELGFQAALRAGFNHIEMMPDERTSFPSYYKHNQPRYLDLRNTILYKWKSNMNTFLTLEKTKENIKDELLEEIEPIWDYLTRYGYINSGIFQGWEKKIVPFQEPVPSVVVIGAGAAGLSCAQQLRQWGYKVTVIEARTRIGGRCNTSKMYDQESKEFSVDIGASIITGLIGNPLDNITNQLGLRTHVIGSNATMLTDTGQKIEKEVDTKMGNLFDGLLEHVSSLKDSKSADKSLGVEMDRILPPLSSGESGILDWYYANLEYACAADLSLLSLNFWDQDDPFDFAGEHLMLVDGYTSMLTPLAEGLDIRLNHKVTRIKTDARGVTVHIDDGTPFPADVVLVTVPLGVLKMDTITFEPPLPQRKREAIKNLGFGLLNKVVILFENKFWDDEIDWFGKVISNNSRENRGLCYLWWNYDKVVHRPVLVAIVAGKACHAIELRKDEDLIAEIRSLLRDMFKLNDDPKIVKYVITRWKSDQFAGGTYSYVALGATGEDYDELAKTEKVFGHSRLFFGGEHTCRQYPATVAGAYASGLREAEKIHRLFNPPPIPTFKPPPITNEIDKTREANRKKLVKQTQKDKKSRTHARFRRGVRRISNFNIGKSGNELYKFTYQYLYGKKELNNSNNNIQKTETSSQQFQSYESLINKKRKTIEDDPNSRRTVVQTQDGRVWYAPKVIPPMNPLQTYSETQQQQNTTTTTTANTTTATDANSTAGEKATIFLGSDNTLPINPYGTFRDNTNDKDDKDSDNDDKKPESKARRQYRSQVAKYVVTRLSRYYKNKRITNRDDFKHLSRKFTHKFITWEDNHGGNYKMDSKKKEKMKKIIDEYFQRHHIYARKTKSKKSKV